MVVNTLGSQGELIIPLFKPAARLKGVKTGGIRRFCDLARELPDCINLSLGEPDFCVSQSALEVGCQAAEKGPAHYTPTNGIPARARTCCGSSSV